MALRLLCGGHAAPLAVRTKEIPDRENFSICSTRDGGVDDRLRRRRRRPIRAPASTSSIHHRDDFTEKRIGDAGKCDSVAGMRCAGSEYELYNADAAGTLEMDLSVLRV